MNGLVVKLAGGRIADDPGMRVVVQECPKRHAEVAVATPHVPYRRAGQGHSHTPPLTNRPPGPGQRGANQCPGVYWFLLFVFCGCLVLAPVGRELASGLPGVGAGVKV